MPELRAQLDAVQSDLRLCRQQIAALEDFRVEDRKRADGTAALFSALLPWIYNELSASGKGRMRGILAQVHQRWVDAPPNLKEHYSVGAHLHERLEADLRELGLR